MNSTVAALDFLLYYDEDQDIDESEMTECSPVEAVHVRELVERGYLKDGEIFSHKGWHHQMGRDNEGWYGSMWNGCDGDEHRYVPDWNEWNQ